jgi:hypothetical protein
LQVFSRARQQVSYIICFYSLYDRKNEDKYFYKIFNNSFRLFIANIAGILTGEAASVHGIVGNMHYDEATKEAAEVLRILLRLRQLNSVIFVVVKLLKS